MHAGIQQQLLGGINKRANRGSVGSLDGGRFFNDAMAWIGQQKVSYFTQRHLRMSWKTQQIWVIGLKSMRMDNHDMIIWNLCAHQMHSVIASSTSVNSFLPVWAMRRAAPACVCTSEVKGGKREGGGDALTLSLILTSCNWNHLDALPEPDPWVKEARRGAEGLKQRRGESSAIWERMQRDAEQERGRAGEREADKDAVEAERKEK